MSMSKLNMTVLVVGAVSLLTTAEVIFAQGGNRYDGIGDCRKLQQSLDYARDVQRRKQREVRYNDDQENGPLLELQLEEASFAVDLARENYDMGGCTRGGKTIYQHTYTHQSDD